MLYTNTVPSSERYISFYKLPSVLKNNKKYIMAVFLVARP